MAEKWWRADWQRPRTQPVDTATREAAERAARAAEARRRAQLRDRATAAVALLACVALTLLVYGDALRFAFTFDDPLDLPRGEGRTVWSLFTSSEGYAYYRPIPFVIWKVLRQLQGRYSEATLHGLTLACHAIAAWLLYLLLRRLTGGHWGLLAAALFITYPFSYQAAFGAHTLFHPLMTAAILASLLLYHAARTNGGDGNRQGRQEDAKDARKSEGNGIGSSQSAEAGGPAGTPATRRSPLAGIPIPVSPARAALLLAASLLAALVALWTHESGVVIFPLIVGLELVITIGQWRQSRAAAFPRPRPWPLLHGAATLAFILAWRAVPKFDRPEPWSRDSLPPNARYFLQGVIWPVAAQLKPLGARLGFDPLAALWPAIVATLVALAALYFLARRPGIPLVALGAAAIVLFPAWLVLTWVYVEDAPRLLYPAAPAIAALWGLLPALAFRRRWLTVGWRAATLLLLAALLAQNLAFIALRRDMWAEGTRLVRGVADTAAARDGRPLLYLNVPAWFAPKVPEYPVGHVGLTALPGYIGLGRSVYIQRGIQPPIESRGYYPDLNGWKYDFNTHGGPASLDDFAALLRGVEAVYLVEMLPGSGARLREVGSLRPDGADRRATGPRFGPGIVLAASSVAFADDGLQADLTWDILAAVPGDVLPVLRVRDGRGQVIAEWRKYPLADTAAPRLFRVGDRVRDRPLLPLPASLAPDDYTIWLTWEEKTLRAPLPGTAADGTPLPAEGHALGTFTIR